MWVLGGAWWLQERQDNKTSEAYYSESYGASLDSCLQAPLSNSKSYCRAPVCHLALITGH